MKLTDSPSFRHWFGNSQVVDASGEPLVVWHGHPEHVDTFYEFDFNRSVDVGMHFGTKEAARRAASGMNPNVRPFFLKITNPFVALDPGDWISGNPGLMQNPIILDQMARKGVIDREEYDEAFNAIEYFREEAKSKSKWLGENDAEWKKYRSKASELLRALLLKHGYDGVVYKNETEQSGSISWIAFAPTQIKSATDNQGTFDPTNPDVRKNSAVDQDLLADIVNRLLAWQGSSLLGASDVLVRFDQGKVFISFRGDALKIERQVYGKQMLSNYNYGLDISLQRALGADAQPMYQGMRVVGVRGDLGQLLDSGEAHYSDVLTAVENVVKYYIEQRGGAEVDVLATLMPSEGAPLVAYYSAKKKKWFAGGDEPPAKDVLVRDRYSDKEVIVRGADLCRIFEVMSNCGSDIVASGRSGDFMVFHCTTPSPEASEALEACGGWLFPSLGVGTVPSVNFGPLALFTGVDIVLSALRPYKTGRGRWPITVYDTDTWTMTTSGFNEAAHELYQQLTGTYREDIYGKKHQWILGAPVSETSLGMDEEVKPITSTGQLIRAIKTRNKMWKPGMTDEQIERFRSGAFGTKHNYPYLEAKANGILPVSCWKLAVVCESWHDRARDYLVRLGFDGTLVTIPDPQGSAEEVKHWVFNFNKASTLNYARSVYAAALQWANETGRIRGFEEA